MRFLAIPLLTACSLIPPIPDFDLCLLDYTRFQVICQGFVDNERKYDMTVEQANNYLMVSPEDWGKIRNYVGDLKDLVEECQTLR
jgi:hypothetical protein